MLGGTFDPVHAAHVVVAVNVRAALRLDRVLLVVAGDPWQKHGEVAAAAPDRLALVEAAVEGIEGLEASPIEVEREGPTYTVDTLATLARTGREMFLVVGADVASRLETWRDVDRVRELATLVIVERDGEARARPPGRGWQVERVTIPRLDISSTDVRARLARGAPIDGLVPARVVALIRDRGLYTADG